MKVLWHSTQCKEANQQAKQQVLKENHPKASLSNPMFTFRRDAETFLQVDAGKSSGTWNNMSMDIYDR